MSLQEKVINLKLQAAIAARHAMFWEKQIQLHGEAKATAFYTHIGLNHLQKKSIEWEGLTLSREPQDHEKICIKGIHAAQESSKEQVTKILLEARKELISDGLKGIKKLAVAQYHELTLTVSPEIRTSLKDRLMKVHRQGRALVVMELSKKAVDEGDEDDFEELDDLVDLTDARVANEIQARIASAAARYTLLGLTGKALWDAVQKEVEGGSTGWLDRAATGAANKTLNVGRSDEMQAHADEIDRYEQSEILDQNTCGPCLEDDGKTASDPDDLPGAPNPDCEGGDYCRGFIVAIEL